MTVVVSMAAVHVESTELTYRTELISLGNTNQRRNDWG